MALHEKLNETVVGVLDATETFTAALPVKVIDDARAAVAAAGFDFGDSMALAITNRRLILLETSGTVVGFGVGGKFERVLGDLPLKEIVHIKVEPHMLRKDITVDLGESKLAFEAPPFTDPREFEQAYVTARAAHPS